MPLGIVGAKEHASTSGFNLTGSGGVHFVPGNVVKDPTAAKPIPAKRLIGAIDAEKTDGV